MSLLNISMLTLTEIFGDMSFQKYVITNDLSFFSMGIVGYTLVIYYLLKSLKQANILRVNLLWDGTSALIETLAAIVILKQSFEHFSQRIGAIMIISGLFLIKFV